MLDTILTSAFESAAQMAGMPAAAQSEFAGRRPGRGPSGFAGLFRRRNAEAEPQVIAGAKPHVERLFRWLGAGQLRVEQTFVAFTLGAFAARLGIDPPTIASLCLEVGLDGTRYAAAIGGQKLEIGQGRTLQLPGDAPLPHLRLVSPKVIEARWAARPAKVTQGRFTADLRGLTMYPDHAEIDVAWALLGFDLAKNPVVWWGD